MCLSGGVFHNRLLTKLICERLRAAEMEAYLPVRVSPGDGGLSYGQAAVAAARIARIACELIVQSCSLEIHWCIVVHCGFGTHLQRWQLNKRFERLMWERNFCDSDSFRCIGFLWRDRRPGL